MNLTRKIEMQERRITSLQNQNERLKKDNSNLKSENEMLSNKIVAYEYQLTSIEDIRKEYLNGIDELKEIQKNYQQVIYDARRSKQQYIKKCKQLMVTTKTCM